MQNLLRRLGEYAEPWLDGGWDEDKDDRRVVVSANQLQIKGTFEHESNNGGSHRVTSTFQVQGNTFVNLESEESCTYAPDDEKALQSFVNERFGFDGDC